MTPRLTVWDMSFALVIPLCIAAYLAGDFDGHRRGRRGYRAGVASKEAEAVAAIDQLGKSCVASMNKVHVSCVENLANLAVSSAGVPRAEANRIAREALLSK